MCGRFFLTSSPPDILAHYGLDDSAMDDGPMPGGEIFPGTSPFVFAHGDDDAGTLRPMFWGFRPFSTRGPRGRQKRPINARCENLFANGYWSPAARSQRCLIPLNSWDEWSGDEGQEQPDQTKRRWRMAPQIDAPLFSLGGVFTTYNGRDGSQQTGFAVITQPANASLKAIHHRQPLIVMPDDYGHWLDAENTVDDVERMLRRQGQNYATLQV